MTFPHARSQFTQHSIAGVMAVAIVDALEMVDVECQDAKQFAAVTASESRELNWRSMKRLLYRPVSGSVTASSIDCVTLARKFPCSASV